MLAGLPRSFGVSMHDASSTFKAAVVNRSLVRLRLRILGAFGSSLPYRQATSKATLLRKLACIQTRRLRLAFESVGEPKPCLPQNQRRVAKVPATEPNFHVNPIHPTGTATRSQGTRLREESWVPIQPKFRIACSGDGTPVERVVPSHLPPYMQKALPETNMIGYAHVSVRASSHL